MKSSTKAAWLAAALLVAGCATTQLKDSWKDPAFTGPPMKRLLVVGVATSSSSRRVFEDAFAKALSAAGTSATASYSSLPESGPIPNERITVAANQADVDGLVITRVLRVKREVSVSPGYASPGFYGAGFRGYYHGAYLATVPDVDVYEVLTIETTLWNLRADKPLWSGTSEVTEPRNVAAATEELAKVLIAKMKADGVI